MSALTPGVATTPEGVRARVCAPAAELVEFCLFNDGSEVRYPMEREGEWWAITVCGIGPGALYGYRTHGPWDPTRHLFHHPALLLVDPYARSLAGDFRDTPYVHPDGPRVDTAPFVPKGVVVGRVDRPRPGPQIPWGDTIIYETHVRHLTMAHPRVPPPLRGTFLGAAHPAVIEHLHRLGVTTVEFMPIAHYVTEPTLQRRHLANVWGYSTLGWFAPHAGYATGDDGRQVSELAAMVDAYHAAGLEVVVDVVFNHTAEGGAEGPVLGMKGLDPEWYRYQSDEYADWTGTGNTVNTAAPRTRQAILAALHWWAEDLGIDGFRFDLAVTLGRGEERFDPAELAWLTEDPVLSRCKLIAEPWDLGVDGYRLGGFGPGWVEWNDRFRDDVRDYWRGKSDSATLARRLAGSPDVFGDRLSSIDYVTCHDGFTLSDLVSYDRKHNEPNGEHNRDGHDDNRSWNSGEEGPSSDPAVAERRRVRAASLLATTLLSGGIPMILGGDELGRTQGGNNNAYALDGPAAWYQWASADRVELVSALVALRRRLPSRHLAASALESEGAPILAVGGDEPVAVVVTNPSDDPALFRLPPGEWRLELDTAQPDGHPRPCGEALVSPWSLRLYSKVAPLGMATTPPSETV